HPSSSPPSLHDALPIYAVLAAERAQLRWANDDALSYFGDVFRRLDGMPDTAANRLRRIDAILKQADVKYALGQYTDHIQALEKIDRKSTRLNSSHGSIS